MITPALVSEVAQWQRHATHNNTPPPGRGGGGGGGAARCTDMITPAALHCFAGAYTDTSQIMHLAVWRNRGRGRGRRRAASCAAPVPVEGKIPAAAALCYLGVPTRTQARTRTWPCDETALFPYHASLALCLYCLYCAQLETERNWRSYVPLFCFAHALG